jgi:cytochrome c nitrite reductase small subunit
MPRLASLAHALGSGRSRWWAGTLWAVLALLLLYGPPGLADHSASPEFCAGCHAMQSRHESWTRMGKHRDVRCTGCHPSSRHWASYALRAGGDGTAGVTSRDGVGPAPIRLSDAGRRAVQASCVRCHAVMVSRIDADRPCWDCHRRATHTVAGRLAAR